jgi:hypothetical protein
MEDFINYKILFKLPSRSRPKRVFEVLDASMENMLQNKNFSFLLTLDKDDETMNNKEIIDKLNTYPNIKIIFGKSNSKIEAVNRDLNEYEDEWDIIVLLSDDMVPVLFGFDERIRKAFKDNFPDLDGVTWFNDGFQGERINTLCILGKKYYNRFKYIYHPEYKSLYSDNEFTEVARRLGKQKYFNTVIIEHKHFSIRNNGERYDDLYKKNDSLMGRDGQVYRERLRKNFDLT